MHIPIIIHLLKYFLFNIIFGNADMAKVPLLGKQLSKCSNRMSYYTNILQIECFTVQTKPILLSEQKYISFVEALKRELKIKIIWSM